MSRLRGWRDLEDRSICGNDFRPWGDLQHVLDERDMFDYHGFRQNDFDFDNFPSMLTGSERLLNLNCGDFDELDVTEDALHRL